MADSEDGARPIDSGEYGSLDTLIACTLLQKDIAITTFSATVSRTAPVSRSHELSRGRRPSGPYRTENELPISHNVAHRPAASPSGNGSTDSCGNPGRIAGFQWPVWTPEHSPHKPVENEGILASVVDLPLDIIVPASRLVATAGVQFPRDARRDPGTSASGTSPGWRRYVHE
jgi:hypothetical protein